MGRDFPPVQTGPGAHPASCKMGTGSFLGVKYGRGVLLTTHPVLVPRSWKSRAIPLPTLWATSGPVTGTLHLHNGTTITVQLPYNNYRTITYNNYLQLPTTITYNNYLQLPYNNYLQQLPYNNYLQQLPYNNYLQLPTTITVEQLPNNYRTNGTFTSILPYFKLSLKKSSLEMKPVGWPETSIRN